MGRRLIERTWNWSVRQKVAAYLVSQALLLGVLLAVVVGGAIGVPLPVLVAVWCGPALGGLIGVWRSARNSSAVPSAPGDIDAGR
ncbi:hypothetical protein SAMN05216533_4651 [Streptomyces sp. Ag109_O5-10]|nr:hypothetical protein SAMN05216533_4651 [Streptomyces sp. Ag109_O5-10]